MNTEGGDVADHSSNFMDAFLRLTARVRVTATIEGSEIPSAGTGTADYFTQYANSFSPTAIMRAKVSVRSDRYRKTVVLSRFKNNWTTSPEKLIPFQTIPDPANPQFLKILDPNAPVFLFQPEDDAAAMGNEADRSQALMGDPKVSGSIVIPWIELSATPNLRPGYVIEKIVEDAPQSGQTPWNIDLSTQTQGGGAGKLAPMIAGLIYTFAQGGFRTTIMTEDFRAMPEMGSLQGT